MLAKANKVTEEILDIHIYIYIYVFMYVFGGSSLPFAFPFVALGWVVCLHVAGWLFGLCC